MTVRWLSNNIFSTFQPSLMWRDRRPTNNCFPRYQAIFEKSRWTVTRQWSEVIWPSADCQTMFLDVSSNWKIFWKKSLSGHATVVGSYATVGRLSNNVFWTFQVIRKNIEKSHWTITRQLSEVTRPSADCQMPVCRGIKQLEEFLKTVAERSRDSGRRSFDQWPTVEQRFFDVSSN